MNKKEMYWRAIVILLIGGLSMIGLTGFAQPATTVAPPDKAKIGFLVHGLISERWQKDVELFAARITELGGEPIIKNANGDAKVQVEQGKALILEGAKVIAVVAADGNALGELVDFAEQSGVKIIAYDRLIKNCDLHYYISYDNVRVGELMAKFIVKIRPKGNYVIINGPESDNNSKLVKQGQMSILQPYIDRGDIKVVLDKSADAWGPLEGLMIMDDFLNNNTKDNPDVVMAASDALAEGVVQALSTNGKYKNTLVTGQDANLTACKNIMSGYQTISVYKSIKKIAFEAADLAMKLSRGESPKLSKSINNGKGEVPSILFEPVVVYKNNLKDTVIKDGHIKEADL
jgi:D-xylose transport system substrate-binding protein